MSFENIILWIIFGALAGFLAGKIMKSSNGLIANVILGIVGSFVGGWLAGQLGIATATGSAWYPCSSPSGVPALSSSSPGFSPGSCQRLPTVICSSRRRFF